MPCAGWTVGTVAVQVELVPWAQGKNHLTTTYCWFLAGWAKRLSWQEVARAFRTSWDNVFRSVEVAVTWGLEQRDLERVESLGIDEIQWQRGHKYLTLVYQIDTHCRRLLWIGQDRKIKTLLRFFRSFGKARCAKLRYICSDMWKPYLRVIAKKANRAIHVLDRFHIMSHMSKAIDEVRAAEARALKANGFQPVLTHTRWLLLKRPKNLTPKAERPARRSRALQPALGPSLPAQGGLPVLLGLHLAQACGSLPRPVVHQDHALQDPAHEGRRPHAALSSRAAAQLVPRQGQHFLRPRRGLQQQGHNSPPEEPSASGPSGPSKWLCITALETYRSLTAPTDSAEDDRCRRRRPTGARYDPAAR